MSSRFSDISEYLSNYFSPSLQIALLLLTAFAVRTYFASRRKKDTEEEETRTSLPTMEKRDFTLDELKPYNGVENERILIAVNGKVFDVSRGRENYGPDGPYHVFAGHDASRGLATFSIDSSNIKDSYDDLSDLNSLQMESVFEWEMQFMEKYDHVGKLLKPGEKHCNYKAEESEDETKTDRKNKKID